MFHLSELSQESKTQRGLSLPKEQRQKCGREGRFNNLCVLDHQQPYLIPNRLLNQENNNGYFLKLSTLQLSLLVPRIRIYKVVYNSDLKKEIEVELPFDDVANKNDLENILKNSSGRGSGAGIKNFKWKTMAINQANLSQFSATLTLYVQNIEEMTKIRNSVEDPDTKRVFNVSFMDLLYQKPDLKSRF